MDTDAIHKGKGKYKSGKGAFTSKGKDKSGGKGNGKSADSNRCHICGKVGHWK